MPRLSETLRRWLTAKSWLTGRRWLLCASLTICALLLIYTFVLEPFQIPTGSMAPTLHGRHRVCRCPRCGSEVVVGRSAADAGGTGEPRYYRKACCPNCGLFPMPVSEAPEVAGHRILVNKAAFVFRNPQRWEIVVFRFLEAFFIKRLLGLPGEEVLIHDGDFFVNGQLVRKTLDEVRSMRMLVFDQDHAPQPGGWNRRWERSLNTDTRKKANGENLLLDGRASPQSLTYCNFSFENGQCEPLRDEYSYNSGLHANSECVHDFMIETDLEIQAGSGSVGLRLCDGHDWVEVLLPVGEPHKAEAFCWPMIAPETMAKLAETAKAESLQAGQRFRIEWAFVDRRLSLAIDGRAWLSADLPEAKRREGVERPFQMQADGVQARLHRFRLYRDVHYGQQGRNGVGGKSVRLGVDQYFVLGDNSPNSQDSRFWSDEGRVPARNLVGSAWLAYGSSPLRQLP